MEATNIQKHLIVIGIIRLVLIVGLSGCTEEAKAKGEEYLNILALCIYFI